MNKITVTRGNTTVNIALMNVKYIIGNSYQFKHNIFRDIRMFFENISLSECSQEMGTDASISINDQLLNKKETLFYEVKTDYSIDTDVKLTSKSLILKYFELLLNGPDFIDTINTINILFSSLSEEINGQSIIHADFTSVVNKQLLKLLIPYYFDEYIKDEYDLEYEEVILLQLELLKYISEHNININHILVIMNITVITNKIMDKLTELADCNILVVTDNYHDKMNIEDIYYCDQNYILDLANEEDIYRYICDNDYYLLTIEEAREKMKRHLQNMAYRQTDLIELLLKKERFI